MENAQYVVTGWVLTGAVLAGYTASLFVRSRRAARTLGPDGSDPAAGDPGDGGERRG